MPHRQRYDQKYENTLQFLKQTFKLYISVMEIRLQVWDWYAVLFLLFLSVWHPILHLKIYKDMILFVCSYQWILKHSCWLENTKVFINLRQTVANKEKRDLTKPYLKITDGEHSFTMQKRALDLGNIEHLLLGKPLMLMIQKTIPSCI